MRIKETPAALPSPTNGLKAAAIHPVTLLPCHKMEIMTQYFRMI